MLILIIILKLETTDKLVEFDDVLILKTMKTWNCQFLGPGGHWNDEVVIIPKINDAVFFIFKVLSFLVLFSLYFLFTLPWLDNYVFISNENWTDGTGAPPLGVHAYILALLKFGL